MVWPVGGTGTAKRLGDFTAADMQAARDYYAERAKAIQAESDAWGGVAAQLLPEETLEQALARAPEQVRDALPAGIRKRIVAFTSEASAAGAGAAA
jgi:hypothetical protein